MVSPLESNRVIFHWGRWLLIAVILTPNIIVGGFDAAVGAIMPFWLSPLTLTGMITPVYSAWWLWLGILSMPMTWYLLQLGRKIQHRRGVVQKSIQLLGYVVYVGIFLLISKLFSSDILMSALFFHLPKIALLLLSLILPLSLGLGLAVWVLPPKRALSFSARRILGTSAFIFLISFVIGVFSLPTLLSLK